MRLQAPYQKDERKNDMKKDLEHNNKMSRDFQFP
jgi:hypothetical protein